MANETNPERALNGTYKHTAGDCKCGHSLDEHDAERTKIDGEYFQFCQADDCDCECYAKPRKTRKA